MKEILDMWKLCRFFKKNFFVLSHNLINSDIKIRELLKITKDSEGKSNAEIAKLYNDQLNTINFQIFLEESNPQSEYMVKREELSRSYLAHVEKYKDEIIGIEKKIHDDVQMREKIVSVNCLINSCIEKEYGFIKEDPNDKTRVCLMVKGKKFADSSFVGLLKEWVKEIGVLWGGIIWTISIIGAANWRLISDLVINLLDK